MTNRRGVIFLSLAAVCGVFAAFVALTGGIDTRLAGVAVRSRSWERPALVALVLAAIGLFSLRQQARAAGRHALPYVPLLVVCSTAIVAWIFSTNAAGGADSYGYVSQAELLAHGRLTDRIHLDPAFTWPDVPATMTPLGYTRGTSPDRLVPTYPPGLPLLMAPFALVSAPAVFLLVPLCAAVAVWACWRLGADLGEPVSGALAAMLLATSPTFLNQSVQPMSDVPVTACWIAALLLARRSPIWSAAAAGALASMAVLVRPNLAPLSALVVAAAATTETQISLRRAAACAAALVPGVVALGTIQYVRYGSPLSSGYGAFHDLFSLRNIGHNLARYPRWLTETHTVFVWVWLLAPIWIVGAAAPVRRLAWICYLFCLAVLAAYLPYVYFRPEEWFYTRFMLPAVPLMLLLGVTVVTHLLRRVTPRVAVPLAACLTVGLAVWYVLTSAAFGIFGLREVEQKYPVVGSFVREHLPDGAYVFAMQHSGSIRYYSGRQTVRWDMLDRGSLDQAVSALRASGHEPFVVVDQDEDAEFRTRFGAANQRAVEQLEPMARIGPTRVYRFR
jgi:4-amino-4-deoxy-L-arabinose transferase-like glycosyltransferase